MRVVTQYRSFPRSVQLLLLNQLTINLGFYMLIPYLADHLSQGLGLSIWLVGLILGVRNFSQQGMFLIGGSLADRFGYKPMIVAGCALRTGGFALLGVVDNIPTLVIASAATGFAGALFNPAVRAYLARDSGDRRVEAFALFSIFYQAGILIGPLIGLALTGIDFSVTCLAAAAVFAVLTVLQIRALPARGAEQPESGAGLGRVLGQWREIAANRGFLLFSIAMIGSYVLSYQVYLALPLQARNLVSGASSSTVLVAAVFAVSGGVTILAQMKVTAWCRQRWGPGRSLGRGLAVLAAAFVPLLLAELVTWLVPTLVGTAAGTALGVVALLAAAAILAVGTAVVLPFEMDTIVALSNDRLVATHYGFYNTVCGIGILLGNTGTGSAMDLARSAGFAPAPWAVLVLIGVGCAAALGALHRRGLLTPPAPSDSAATPARAAADTAADRHDQQAPTTPIPVYRPTPRPVDDLEYPTRPITAAHAVTPAARPALAGRGATTPGPGRADDGSRVARPARRPPDRPDGPGPIRQPGHWFAPARPTPLRPGTALTGRRAAAPGRTSPTERAYPQRPV